MRLSLAFFTTLPFLALLVLADTPPTSGPSTELDIAATAAFPPTNPFAHVVNGERNKLTLEIENKSPVNVTLRSAGGSIHDPDTGKFLKNTTTLSYSVALHAGTKTILPYTFYSEHKPREVTLKLWVNYDDGSSSVLHRTMAYDSVVTIVEPPASIFDLPLLFSYLVLLGAIGGAGYFIYHNYVPKSLKKKTRKPVTKAEISSPIDVTAKKTYDEQWIPSHHLGGKKKTKKEGVVSSGDESAAERRRSSRKAAQKSS